jgi:sugar-specific transcriptional regulator TrmB
LVLVQPGDPPRYSAQDPRAVFDRYRATMETTLHTLTATLASLEQVDRMGEFWVVRGQQNILAQVRSMIAHAQETLDLRLPAQFDVAGDLMQAQARSSRIFHVKTEEQDSDIMLLLRDGREALIGTVTPPDSCQAVVTSNAALLEALHGYFLSRRAPGRALSEVMAKPSQPRDVDWMDWEARKQRRLRGVNNENRVA